MANKGQLSPREAQILRRRKEGESYKEIAAALSLSLNTVKWHMKNILHKTNTKSSAQAIHRLGY